MSDRENPNHPRAEWRREWRNGATTLDYWDWVAVQRGLCMELLT